MACSRVNCTITDLMTLVLALEGFLKTSPQAAKQFLTTVKNLDQLLYDRKRRAEEYA
jgi:uncharacterized protein YjeT (DUF2065 family)